MLQAMLFLAQGPIKHDRQTDGSEIGSALIKRLQSGEVREIILATSTTVEGEATAHFIHGIAKDLGVATSRLAYGMPLGGELEFVDGATLTHAFKGRRAL